MNKEWTTQICPIVACFDKFNFNIISMSSATNSIKKIEIQIKKLEQQLFEIPKMKEEILKKYLQRLDVSDSV